MEIYVKILTYLILVMHYPPYCSEFNPIEPNSTLF